MLDKKLLPLVLLLTGTFNVLLIKWADKQYSKGRDANLRLFQHPFLQTIILFFGEFLCFVLYKILFKYLSRRNDGSEDTNFLTSGDREFSPSIFFKPALLELFSTFLSFTGIYRTFASSYQILRGTSLIFVGLFSGIILDQKLKNHHWFGILTIILSSILICICDSMYNPFYPDTGISTDSNLILTGDLYIISAQIGHAMKIIYEEKYLKTLNLPPLQVIGWEGIYGLVISIILLIPMYYLNSHLMNNPSVVLEDIYDATIQIFNNKWLIISHLLFIIFVMFEKYSTTAIIKDASGSAPVIIHSISIIFIWIASLLYGWELFSFIEFISLIILYIGICLYKNVLFGQAYRSILITLFRRRGDETEEVISQPADAVI